MEVKNMQDTVGNIISNLKNCDCNLTGGCSKCRPSFIGCISNREAKTMKKILKKWKKRFNEDFEKS